MSGSHRVHVLFLRPPPCVLHSVALAAVTWCAAVSFDDQGRLLHEVGGDGHAERRRRLQIDP